MKTAIALAILACAVSSRASAQESNEIALLVSGCDPAWIETALVPALRIESGREVRVLDGSRASGEWVRITCEGDEIVVERGRSTTFETRAVDVSDVEGANRDRTLALVLADLSGSVEPAPIEEVAPEPVEETPIAPGTTPEIGPVLSVPPPPPPLPPPQRQRTDSERPPGVGPPGESAFEFRLGFFFEADLLFAELNTIYGFAVRPEFRIRDLDALVFFTGISALRGEADDRATGTISVALVRGVFGLALGAHTGPVRPSVALELRPGWLLVSGEATIAGVRGFDEDRAHVDTTLMGRLHVHLAEVAYAALELGLAAVVVGFEARADDRSVFDLRGFALSGRLGFVIAFE